MTKQDLTKILRNAKIVLSKNSPEILTGIGIAGMVTTTILAVKATPKVLTLIDEAERKKKDTLTISEKVKVAYKPYIPATLIGTASIACLIGASSVNVRRKAALYSAYKLSETALLEYKEKVVETIGEKKEKAIKDKIAKDKIDRNPVSKADVVITERGNTLCYDAMSGRYFRSDIDKIKKAANELNRRMISEMYISLNEFYAELGLHETSLGDCLGWNVDEGLIEPYFSSQIAEDGTPCIVIDYLVAPRYDYEKLM